MTHDLIKRKGEFSPNVRVLNLLNFFMDDEMKPRSDLFSADEIHLNPKGSCLLSGLIKQAIESIVYNRNCTFLLKHD